MQLESKYNLGDCVYYSMTESREVREVCPECNGEKGFAVVGKDFKAACRACRYGGYGQPTGYVAHWDIFPAYRSLTIGRVGVEVTADKRKEEYMAYETGVGSGSLYYVERLFPCKEQALENAAFLVIEEKRRRAEELAERERRQQTEYAEMVESGEA